jgi:hypothetical protein
MAPRESRPVARLRPLVPLVPADHQQPVRAAGYDVRPLISTPPLYIQLMIPHTKQTRVRENDFALQWLNLPPAAASVRRRCSHLRPHAAGTVAAAATAAVRFSQARQPES